LEKSEIDYQTKKIQQRMDYLKDSFVKETIILQNIKTNYLSTEYDDPQCFIYFVKLDTEKKKKNILEKIEKLKELIK
jgi:hypothetical protein